MEALYCQPKDFEYSYDLKIKTIQQLLSSIFAQDKVKTACEIRVSSFPQRIVPTLIS